MAYIGKTPTVGNFVKLDALTTSATASYTMQVDSVNFSPESVNHMLVSLNGVIQAPTTSYTISGSTITFASALTSSDSIDFIMVYGNVLDIGTPSDATVTNAKTNFVSTSSASGLQIKGDGTTDGTLQLNCSQNSHGIKLKSPPHSASASYTLTFPNDDGSSGQALTTNGSGVLTWANAGGTNTPSFHAYGTSGFQAIPNATNTVVNVSNEKFDSDNAFSTSTKRFTPQTAGKYFVYGNIVRDGNWSAYARLYLAVNGNVGNSETLFNTTDDSGGNGGVHVSGIIDMNGSSDYIELIVRHDAGNSVNLWNSGLLNFFGAFRVLL